MDRIKKLRDCPACGTTFGSVAPLGRCPTCGLRSIATPTQILLAGKLGSHDAERLLLATAEYHEVPLFRQLDFPVCKVTAQRIPRSVARSFQVIPLIIHGETRCVVSDPAAEALFEVLTMLIEELPQFAIATPGPLSSKIGRYYGGAVPDSWKEMDVYYGTPEALNAALAEAEKMDSIITGGQKTATHVRLTGSTFTDVCLGEAKFDDVNLGNATFHNINLAGTTFENVNLSQVAISNANLTGMTINGILVTELLAAYKRSPPK